MLYIYGPPGSGKTVLGRYIYENHPGVFDGLLDGMAPDALDPRNLIVVTNEVPHTTPSDKVIYTGPNKDESELSPDLHIPLNREPGTYHISPVCSCFDPFPNEVLTIDTRRLDAMANEAPAQNTFVFVVSTPHRSWVFRDWLQTWRFCSSQFPQVKSPQVPTFEQGRLRFQYLGGRIERVQINSY